MSSVLPVVSLLFFLGLFVGVVLWLFLTRKSRWDADARIPLDDGPDPVTPRRASPEPSPEPSPKPSPKPSPESCDE